MPLSSRSKSLTAISVRNTPARSTCGGAPGQSSLPSWITRWNYARSCTRQTRSSPSISSYAKSPRTADISRTRTLRSSCCTWGCATSPATEEAIRGREPTTGLWRLTPWRNCSLDGFRCVRISLVAKSPQTYTEIVTGSPPKPPAIHKLAPPTEPGRPAPVDRPPTPPDKPAAPASSKPSSPPTDASLPHSPTESRSPVAEKPAGEAPRSPVSPDQHAANTPGMPGERAPSTHPQSLEPAAARPPGPQVGNPAEPAMAAAPAAQSAPAGAAPHLPMPESSPPNAHPPPPP